MANYVTNTAELTSIANAIRAKGGTTAPLTYPQGFVTAINDISGGGGGQYEMHLVNSTMVEMSENTEIPLAGSEVVPYPTYLIQCKVVTDSDDTAYFYLAVHSDPTVSVTPIGFIDPYITGYFIGEAEIIDMGSSIKLALSWYFFVQGEMVETPLSFSDNGITVYYKNVWGIDTGTESW